MSDKKCDQCGKPMHPLSVGLRHGSCQLTLEAKINRKQREEEKRPLQKQIESLTRQLKIAEKALKPFALAHKMVYKTDAVCNDDFYYAWKALADIEAIRGKSDLRKTY